MEDALTYTGGGGPDGGTVVTRLPDDQRVVGSNSISRLRSCIMHLFKTLQLFCPLIGVKQ